MARSKLASAFNWLYPVEVKITKHPYHWEVEVLRDTMYSTSTFADKKSAEKFAKEAKEQYI